MPLTLTVLRCPENVPPETRCITGGEFTVGRGPGVDWVLPDPERLLSKRHFAIAYRAGAWQIADTSTNGTTMNRDAAPIGHGAVRTLRDGDRLNLGAYEIEVRLTEDAGQGLAFGGGHPAGRDASPFADPFALDPLAPPPPARRPFEEAADPFALSPGGAQLPADFDPLAPDPNPAPFLGPTQEDHRPALEDAFRPPGIGFGQPVPGGRLPPDALLPDDWEKDLLSGIQPAVGPVRPTPPAASPPRGPASAPPPQAAPPVAPPIASPGGNPFAEPQPPPAARADEAGPAGLAPTPFDEPFDLGPQTPPPAPPAATPAVPGATPPAPGAADSLLLAAFLEGARMDDAVVADPAATMRRLGAAFRALVGGLRAVLIARASIKSEFRIEQTMIRARGNNPLKFSAGDDDALAALLGTGRRTDMTAADAVSDALRDIRMHELASMAAMQTAVRRLLDDLDPAKLRARTEQGGLSVLPAQRKARAWDAYEALYAQTVQALADDFDSVFGKAFARAYERALDEITAGDK